MKLGLIFSQYPNVDQHYRRQSARTHLRLHSERGLLRRTDQLPCELNANHWRSIRSHGHPDGHSSVTVYPDALHRVSYLDVENKETVQAPHKQLHAPGGHHRADLQIAMAGGTVLQMDQAAPPNQGLLRDQRERREDSYLNCRIGLRAGGSRPQRLTLPTGHYQMLQTLSVTIFEKLPFYGLSSHPTPSRIVQNPFAYSNRLNLFTLWLDSSALTCKAIKPTSPVNFPAYRAFPVLGSDFARYVARSSATPAATSCTRPNICQGRRSVCLTFRDPSGRRTSRGARLIWIRSENP